MKITLSFDNGPVPEVTPVVLDVLATHGIQATFFVIGSKLDERGLEIAHEAHSAGHWIGNHTWTHSQPLGRSPQRGAARREILLTQERIAGMAHESKFFRPVGGGGGGVIDDALLNQEALQTLTDGGFTMVLWNVVPRDWERPDDWVDRALAGCRAREHSLVVIHDLPNGAMSHLDEFVERALDDGAEFEQGFPADCTPIVGGSRVLPVADYVS